MAAQNRQVRPQVFGAERQSRTHMRFDLDATTPGLRECPRCSHTMVWLRDYNAIRRNEGYLLDYGTDNYAATWVFTGELGLALHWLYRNTIQPVTSLVAGRLRQARHDRILRRYPDSLLCEYCGHLLKR